MSGHLLTNQVVLTCLGRGAKNAHGVALQMGDRDTSSRVWLLSECLESNA